MTGKQLGNQPAFPCHPQPGEISGWNYAECLTKREHFAGLIMAQLHSDVMQPHELAALAIDRADALLDALAEAQR